jgi:hypothetical protein
MNNYITYIYTERGSSDYQSHSNKRIPFFSDNHKIKREKKNNYKHKLLFFSTFRKILKYTILITINTEL